MASAVLFIGWNRPHPGREDEAYQWFASAGREYVQTLEGTFCERSEMIALTPHGGQVNGFILLFGERAKLDELRRTDEFEAFSMQLGRRFLGHSVVPGLNWEGIQGVMTRRAAQSGA